MKYVLTAFVFLISLSASVFAGESHYEVYYFHASWRCTNCTNAEAWAGEAVESIKRSNPGVKIVYAPKQLEKNKSLVNATNAKRVDLVVAEIQNGKMVRHQNIGNLLSVIDSKPTLLQMITDGIVRFSAQSKGAPHLNPPGGMATVQQSTSTPNRKIAVYVLARNANNAPNPRIADVVAEVLSRDFAMQVQSQGITPTIIDVDVPQNKAWAEMFQAQPGDVVVAVLNDNNMESYSTVKGPQSLEQEQMFVASFANTIRQNVGLAGL